VFKGGLKQVESYYGLGSRMFFPPPPSPFFFLFWFSLCQPREVHWSKRKVTIVAQTLELDMVIPRVGGLLVARQIIDMEECSSRRNILNYCHSAHRTHLTSMHPQIG
jgi:hypothetical protein